MTRRRAPRVRFIRPPWNAKRATCDKCGMVEVQEHRLLFRLSTCTTCIEEARHVPH
jgi:hypothetical protein